MSDDGLTWTFNLREGVKFHDGSDWNADAAKANLDRVREMGKGAAYIFNFSHYSNPEYDTVLDEALRLQGSDQAMAIEKFMETQLIAYDDAVAMCLVDLQKTILHRADLGGVGYNAAYETVSVYNLRRM